MADKHEATATLPDITVRPQVQSELEFSLNIDHAAILSESQRLKLGGAALGDVNIAFFENKVSVEFNGDAKGRKKLLQGDANGNNVRIFMGSIATSARQQHKRPGNTLSLDEILSIEASCVLDHELKHVADNVNMGERRLRREDMRYERRRLTRAALPGAVVIAALTGYTALTQIGISLLRNAPWWARGVAGIASLALFKDAFTDIYKARRKAREHTYRPGEQVYRKHPYEKRAYRQEAQYRRRLLLGKAPLLVQVKTLG